MTKEEIIKEGWIPTATYTIDIENPLETTCLCLAKRIKDERYDIIFRYDSTLLVYKEDYNKDTPPLKKEKIYYDGLCTSIDHFKNIISWTIDRE